MCACTFTNVVVINKKLHQQPGGISLWWQAHTSSRCIASVCRPIASWWCPSCNVHHVNEQNMHLNGHRAKIKGEELSWSQNHHNNNDYSMPDWSCEFSVPVSCKPTLISKISESHFEPVRLDKLCASGSRYICSNWSELAERLTVVLDRHGLGARPSSSLRTSCYLSIVDAITHCMNSMVIELARLSMVLDSTWLRRCPSIILKTGYLTSGMHWGRNWFWGRYFYST